MLLHSDDEMKGKPDPSQSLQRIKVGMIGLAAVVMLIALASTVLRLATHEQPVGGSAQANVVAEMAVNNDTLMMGSGEPLAEMGAAPSSANPATAPAPVPTSGPTANP